MRSDAARAFAKWNNGIGWWVGFYPSLTRTRYNQNLHDAMSKRHPNPADRCALEWNRLSQLTRTQYRDFCGV